MSKFIPFRAVRPPRDRAHLVGSRSYVNYTEEELDAKLKANPFTFLHIINPELHPVKHKNISHRERYELVRKEYEQFLELGHFEKDRDKAYYLYRQTKDQHQFVGIIGGISVDSYRSGEIKIHEETLTRKEELFEMYLEVTRFNAEPVLLTYDDREEIHSVQNKYLDTRPEFEFHTTDLVKHEMWLIEDKEDQELLSQEFDTMDHIYIADGHHRSASSALLSERIDEGSKYKNYFMAMMIPTSNLKIFDFNRLVRSLNGMRKDELLDKLEENFTVELLDAAARPTKKGQMSMYIQGEWYRLTMTNHVDSGSMIAELDAQLLTDLILQPLFGIEDLKTDHNIDFINGLEGTEGIEKAVGSGRFKVGFVLFPVGVEELKSIADSGLIMPPKTTWIEPKLRSGLTIYEIF